MNKPTFNTNYIKNAQISIDDIMSVLRSLMIEDIKTAVNNTENYFIELKEQVHLPYSEYESCYAVWTEEDDLYFGFDSMTITEREVKDVGFEVLNHVYNTLQNEGYFNPENYNI